LDEEMLWPSQQIERINKSSESFKESMWAGDGRKVFYRSRDEIMVVSVKTKPSFRLKTPEIMFKGVRDYFGLDFYSSCDISPDGDRLPAFAERRRFQSAGLH
jgi:hypothetical protein